LSTPGKELRAIRVLGIALVAIAVASAGILLLWPGSPFALARLHRDRSFLPLYLIGPVVVLYLVTGVGLIVRARWGYTLLRCFLYLLYLAFPIGTVFSYLALSYVRRHRIKRHFAFEVADLPAGEVDEDRSFKIVGVVVACALALVFLWMMLAF
jgi:hypothetical protein